MAITRRGFILGGLSLTGALVVGWSVSPARQRLHASNPIEVENGAVALNGWLSIAPNGRVTLMLHKSEMGQGISTALPMLVAEELDVPLAQIDLKFAGIDKIYGNVAMLVDALPFHPDEAGKIKAGAQWMTGKLARELGIQVTGGSSSIKDSWHILRQAGASARGMLIAAAAAQWKLPAEECQTKDGKVFHQDGKVAGYGDLAHLAANANPGLIKLKTPAQFTLIGTPQTRRDNAEKTNGQAKFGIDVRLPNMLFAAIKMCPHLGGKVGTMNDAAISKMAGVVKVMNLNELNNRVTSTAGVVVVAKNYWQAKTALDALQVEWIADNKISPALSSKTIFEQLTHQLDTESGFAYFKQGEVKAANSNDITLKAEYSAPFLAHATMEPMNCTAQCKDGKVQLWLGTQNPSFAVNIAAKVAKIDTQNVQLHHHTLGGGFGRRLEVDMVAQAVAISLQTEGQPVQLIWSREQDVQHDFYRPAALARFDATLNAQGEVVAYHNKSASGSVTQQVLQRYYGLPAAGPDKTTAEGEFDMPYEFAHQHIAHVIAPSDVPIGYWRSVGHSHNAFFKESFIDELANAAKQTPVAFRQKLLQQHPRHLAVLNAAVALAQKNLPLPEGHAHGVALHQSFGSIVAQVAQVSIEGTGNERRIAVHKVSCAIDCGLAVNPNTIKQQMESAVIFGLSAALYGEITLEAGQVKQSNFHDYQVARMFEAPLVELEIIPSTEIPEGVGEPGTPPIAPAIANALFELTGQRLRSLPLRLG